MASHKSALKKNRQDERRRQRNRHHRSRLRSRVRKLRLALAAGDLAAAEGMLRETLSIVDRSAKLGVIRSNTASRTKSRLATAINRARARA